MKNKIGFSFSLLLILFFSSCQDTSTFEQGEIAASSVTTVDSNFLSTYDSVYASESTAFQSYLTSKMTLTEGLLQVEKNTLVTSLTSDSSCITFDDSFNTAVNKLQNQIKNGACTSGSSAKLQNGRNITSTNNPFISPIGFLSDSSEFPSGLTFGDEGELELYVNGGLIFEGKENETILYGNLNIEGEVFNLSDKTQKRNISPIKNAKKILSINGVDFNWKDSNKEDFGLFAQEVEKDFPEAVTTDSKGLKRVNYAKLIAPLIEIVKIQQLEIEKLKKAVAN